MKLNLSRNHQWFIISSIALYIFNKELYYSYASYNDFWNSFYYLNEGVLKVVIPMLAYRVILNTMYKSIALCLFLMQGMEFITVVWRLTDVFYSDTWNAYINMTWMLLILIKLFYDVKRTSKN